MTRLPIGLAGASAATLLTSLALAAPALAVPNPGNVVVSEFRLEGPGGSSDEYVKLTNKSAGSENLQDARITLLAADGESDYARVRTDGTGNPANTLASGASVLFKNMDFSLVNAPFDSMFPGATPPNGFTNPDAATFDAPSNGAVAYFREASNGGENIDKVGFAGGGGIRNGFFIEGTGLTPTGTGTSTGQYAFIRRIVSGRPQDTGNNSNDFLPVSTDATLAGQPVALGSPNPTNAMSPIVRSQSALTVGKADPSQPTNSVPNRQFVPSGNGGSGVLTLRRTITNNTGAALPDVRFRITGITTLNNLTDPNTQVVLRAKSSTNVRPGFTGTTLDTTGGAMEATPAGAATSPRNGGGLNSALSAGSFAAGQSKTVELQFFADGVSMQKVNFAVSFVPEG